MKANESERQVPPRDKWHFGCGGRFFTNWYNTDRDIDVRAPLPFVSACFRVALGQHVIEHLGLLDQVLPLLAELRRVVRLGGALYLSCPDLEIVCRAYCEGKLKPLIDGRKRRFPGSFDFQGPESHFVNEMFYQDGDHKNLFDFDLLRWALLQTGWQTVRRITEEYLLEREKDVRPRNDGEQALYVVAE